MANDLILMAEPRTALGKKNKALRREGMVPGVVYGPAVEGTVQVSVNRRTFDRFFQRYGHTTLFTVKWEGGSQQVMIKEVQVDPVKRNPLHIDFFAPNLRNELVTSVPVVLFNHNSAALGLVNQVMDTIDLRSLPAHVPQQINADVHGLVSLEDELRAGQLELPEGVSLVADPDLVIAAVVPSRMAEVEEAIAVEEAPSAAETQAEVAAEAEPEAES